MQFLLELFGSTNLEPAGGAASKQAGHEKQLEKNGPRMHKAHATR
jgi:hypothetical protein